MLGAACALLGREQGVAVILGTGSNSCFYDGVNIVREFLRWVISWVMRVVVLQ